ncbi:hypothetical protein KUCAC02_019140 [Chaenocephalus aceratus]|uniref:Uncharacterized protein n=1 Tax=Chaenocephalus aceratus TaxID=36190 RepID=A0ACB9WAJ4_CHAAC|nr:hypothetical protein KUCAC02_019140 [Chaenocephalus aceratus]
MAAVPCSTLWPQVEMQLFLLPPSGPQVDNAAVPCSTLWPSGGDAAVPCSTLWPSGVMQRFPAPPLGSMIFTPVSSQVPVLVAAPQALNASLSLLFLLLVLLLLHTAKH